MLEILDECRERYDVKLLGYVLMPEHVHLAVWAENAADVRVFVREFLRHTSATMGIASGRKAVPKKAPPPRIPQ
ncbi:MAG: transposase [Armatimonadota bacterium]